MYRLADDVRLRADSMDVMELEPRTRCARFDRHFAAVVL